MVVVLINMIHLLSYHTLKYAKYCVSVSSFFNKNKVNISLCLVISATKKSFTNEDIVLFCKSLNSLYESLHF